MAKAMELEAKTYELDPYGLKWMGLLPGRRVAAPVKRAFDIQLGKMLQNSPDSEADLLVPYLKALHVYWGAVTTGDLPEMWASPSDLEQYEVRDGDLLVCEGGEAGRAGIVIEPPNNCIIQNALHRVRGRQSGNLRFLMYALHAVSSAGWFDVLCNKATIAHFTREKFTDLRIPIPEIEEQRAIADFLERETSQIDALIAQKQRQIELLGEKRAALISHTVIRGLNYKASFRDSGIEGLGKIPCHWELNRLKYITPHVTVGIVVTPSKYYVEEGVPCLRSLNVRDGGLTDTDLVFISPESNELHAKSKLKAGDVVAVRSGQPGTTAVVDERFDGANCIDLIIIRQSGKFDSRFLAYAMGSHFAKSQFGAGSGGAIQQHFNIETAGNFLVPLPPVDEQVEIRKYLDEEIGRLRCLEEKIHTSIDMLNEHRAALISAAVTGKIDIRKEGA